MSVRYGRGLSLVGGPVNELELEVQLRSIRDWSVVATGIVPNHFGECYCSFEGAGPPGAAAILLGAGQDGSDLFWLQRAGKHLEWTQESSLSNPGPVEFSPVGNECLIHEVAVTVLHRFEFPSLRHAGRCDTLLDGVLMGSPVVYLNQDRALVLGYPGRVVLFDVPGMRAVEEVIVAGHEPRPLREWGWYTGVGTREVLTDIQSLARIGPNVVLVYKIDFQSGPLSVRDGLVSIPVADLIN